MTRRGKSTSAIRALAAVAIAAGGTLALSLLGGCNTSGCTENQSSIPLAGFYNSATGRSIVLDSIAVGGVGAPDDSLLYSPGTRLTEIYLPLRSLDSSTSFFIHYAETGLDFPELNDTITLDYTSTPYFASEECGAMYRYNITRMDYTTHMIDSVVIVDSLITNVAVRQFKIFFRVIEQEDTDQ